MNITRKLVLLLLALGAFAAFAAGCGSDKKDSGSDSAATQTTATDETATDETATDDSGSTDAAAAIDEDSLRQFIDAINEDPSIICDPDNATSDLLDQLGGEEACKTASADEQAGKDYSIDDIQIDGDTATATITDDDSTDEVTFVQEGDQLKISGSDSQPSS